MRLPYTEVEFRKDGSAHDDAQVEAALGLVREERATDVVLLVHGWNNDLPAARRMYERLVESIDAARRHVPASSGRRIVVVGVLWPSIRWADDIAAGGAGVGDETQLLLADIAEQVDDAAVAAELEGLVPQIDVSPAARARYLAILRDLLPEHDVEDDDAPPEMLRDPAADPDTAFDLAASATDFEGAPELVGGAAGFNLGGLVDGARKLLNTVTYYTMKARAGTVGSRGVATLLDRIGADAEERGEPVRLHLVGHSFGARVVASAAKTAHPRAHSLSLLQGAFSHFGFARDWDGGGADGLFRAVPGRVRGPVIVTHTRNDRAVGLAYAVASRLANQVAAGLGDEDDVYGGIGSNGALKTPEATPPESLRAVGATYRFEPRRVTNLRADEFIADHSAVTGPEVGYAVLTAMSAGT